MSNSQYLLLEMEKEELIKEKDNLVNEAQYMGVKCGHTQEKIQKEVYHIMSEFQQTMEVVIKEQERLKEYYL